MNIFQKSLAIVFALVLLQTNLMAHGANCSCSKHPKSVSAPHGGLLEQTEELAVELTTESGQLQFFVMTPNLKPIPTKDLSVSGELSFPRNRPPARTINIVQHSEYFSAQVDIPKRAYRYTVNLNVSYQNQISNVQFVVEHSALSLNELDHIDSLSYER